MGAKRPHKKGSDFERKIAKQIREAFAPLGFHDEDCRRTPLSGGHPFGEKTDLILSDPMLEYFPFAVEMKFHASWNCHRVIENQQREWDWIEKTRSSCSVSIRQRVEALRRKRITFYPLLIMKGNFTKVYGALPAKTFESLFGNSPLDCPKIFFWHLAEDYDVEWLMLPWDSLLFLIVERAEKMRRKKR